MDLGLRGKVAIVAAWSQGMGKATALALAKEGAKLVICSRHKNEINRAATEIQNQTGSEVHPVVADVCVTADISKLVREALATYGSVHILVNNAGVPPTGDNILSVSDDEWLKAHNLTLMSMVRMTRAVLPHMIKQRWGRIITISSFVAKQPIDEIILSASIRPGIHGLTRVLSNEYAKHNITANTVCPGFILTERQEELFRIRCLDKKENLEEHLANQAKDIPAGRFGKPEEIGEVVAFLASERASYISGVNLLIDGGLVKGIH